MPCPSHSSRSDHPNNISWLVQIKQQFSKCYTYQEIYLNFKCKYLVMRLVVAALLQLIILCLLSWLNYNILIRKRFLELALSQPLNENWWSLLICGHYKEPVRRNFMYLEYRIIISHWTQLKSQSNDNYKIISTLLPQARWCLGEWNGQQGLGENS